MSGIITLTTDFGLTDEYAGVMKGVILSHDAGLRIVDLCHGLERHDLHAAAWMVATSYRYFPPGTVHVVVVDPGVGGGRRLILLRAGGHLFLAPDNGILTLAARDGFEAVHALDCPHYYLQPVSNTFHGRDILAPVAARVAGGLEPEAVGPGLTRDDLVLLDTRLVSGPSEDEAVIGEVIAADRFGNLLTNISGEALPDSATEVIVTIRGTRIKGVASSYERRPAGALLAIIGSRGLLEIAVNQGSAAERLGAGAGERVEVVEVRG